MGERVGERLDQGCRVDRGHGADQQGVILEWLARMVEDGERGEWLRAEPVGQQGLDLCGCGVVRGQRVGTARDGGHNTRVGGGPGVVGGVGSDEEAGSAEADGLGFEDSRRDARGFGSGQVGIVADGDELTALSAEEGGVRWIAHVFDSNAQADGCGRLAEFGRADRLEQTCAVAQENGRRGDWIPENIAKAAQGGTGVGRVGGGQGDRVPVGGERLVGGRANALQALSGG